MRSFAVVAFVAVLATCCLSAASVSADLPPNTVRFDTIVMNVCSTDNNCVPKTFYAAAGTTGCYENSFKPANVSVGYEFTSLNSDNVVGYTEKLFSGVSCQGDVISQSAAQSFQVDAATVGSQNYTVDASQLALPTTISKIYNYTVTSQLFATVYPAGTIEFGYATERVCGKECDHVNITAPLQVVCTDLKDSTTGAPTGYSSRVVIQPVVNDTIVVWGVLMYSVPDCSNDTFSYALPNFPPTNSIAFDPLAYGIQQSAPSAIFNFTKADGTPIVAKEKFFGQLTVTVNVVAPVAPEDDGKSSNGLLGLPSFLMGIGLLLAAGLLYLVCLKKKVESSEPAPSAGTSYHSMA